MVDDKEFLDFESLFNHNRMSPYRPEFKVPAGDLPGTWSKSPGRFGMGLVPEYIGSQRSRETGSFRSSGQSALEEYIFFSGEARKAYNDGIDAYEANQLEEAIQHFQRALKNAKKKGPISHNAYILPNLSASYIKNGNFNKAFKLWKKYKGKIPPFFNIGYQSHYIYPYKHFIAIHCMKGEWSKALELCKKHSFPEDRLTKAVILKMNGDLNGAINSCLLSDSEGFSPRRVFKGKRWYYLAKLHSLDKNPKNSVKCLDYAIKKDSTWREKASEDPDLRDILIMLNHGLHPPRKEGRKF